jgi:hypothetical protein
MVARDATTRKIANFWPMSDSCGLDPKRFIYLASTLNRLI